MSWAKLSWPAAWEKAGSSRKHGAIQEAYHVFIKNGLFVHPSQELNILEIGFGTGLNAFLTALESEKLGVKILYEGVEAYPVLAEELSQLNYAALIAPANQALFDTLHKLSWDESHSLSSQFSIKKRNQFFSDIGDVNVFDIIYVAAFVTGVQHDVVKEAILKRMVKVIKSRRSIVAYGAKGSVRRSMQAVGFSVERLEGPPGKREMLRAIKPTQKC